MRAQALFSVLSKKMKDEEIIFVDSLNITPIKTKTGVEVIKSLAKVLKFDAGKKSRKPRILTALYERNPNAEKSLRNISTLEISFLKNLNPLDVLNHKYLLIENPEESVKFLASRG